MDKNKIKEAVDWYKEVGSKTNVYEHVLRNLAKEVLAVAGKMPEKKYDGSADDYIVDTSCCEYIRGFNKCHDLCTLAIAPKKVEEIDKAIQKWIDCSIYDGEVCNYVEEVKQPLIEAIKNLYEGDKE